MILVHEVVAVHHVASGPVAEPHEGFDLFDELEPGSLVIDMSSSQPTETRVLAEEADRRGLQLIDAPVSGGVSGAVAGTLTIMVGGSAEQFERCRPVLEAIGGRVLHVGPVGAGHALKALNNLLSGTTLIASAANKEPRSDSVLTKTSE